MKTARFLLSGIRCAGGNMPIIIHEENTDIICFWMDIATEIKAEMDKARQARLAGNEGMARVCARRAAGMAARSYLHRHDPMAQRNGWGRPGSAYEALKALAVFPHLPPHLALASQNLTLRVSDTFQLPEEVDLIADADTLIGGLK